MSDAIETLKAIKSRAFFAGRAGLPYTEDADVVVNAMNVAIEEIDALQKRLNALNQTLQGVVMAQNAEPVQEMHKLESRAECFGCGSHEVLATPYKDMAGRALFNLQCTVCGRQWQQIVDYVETLTGGDGTEVRE